MIRALVALIILIGLGAGAFLFLKGGTSSGTPVPITTSSNTDEFGIPTKSLHWVSNIPEHGSTLPATPTNVVINFNFDLSEKSSVEIMKDSEDYGVGETKIDQSKQTMRREFSQNAPDGVYSINYTACWPDGTCHEGNFKFAIDSSMSASFINLTGRKEVTVSMENIAFDQSNIKVSLGTKVTWVNNEPVGHYINTDPHPGHNYYPGLNSDYLEKGDSYSYIFNSKGFYPYHCSAHYDLMKGAVIVE